MSLQGAFGFLILAVLGWVRASAQITAAFTAPYYENFDSSNFVPGLGGNNLGGILDSNWLVTPNEIRSNGTTQYFWGPGTGFTPSLFSGPSGDHTTGNGHYVFAESSNYAEDRAKLITPYIDLDTLSNPELSFYKHQYGSDIFDFSVQIVVNGFWFGSIYNSSGPKPDRWEKVTIPLTQYAGNSVAFIFIAWRNTAYPGNGKADIAIDDVRVDNPRSCPAPFAQQTQSVNNTFPYSLAYDASASTGIFLDYTWDFDDGNSSNSKSGVHTYISPGEYDVQLTTTDDCGQQDTALLLATICDTTLSNFSFQRSAAGISFSALSTTVLPGVDYTWDFGDGTSDTGKTVVHSYAVPGQYAVTLSISTKCGTTLSRTELIESCSKPTASWTYTLISSSPSGMLIQFNGSSSVGASDFFWDFGDGNSSLGGANIVHTYAVPGLFYTVSLIVSNDCQQTDTARFQLSALSSETFERNECVVYPNPSKGTIYLEHPGIGNGLVEFQLTDVRGLVIMSGKVHGYVGVIELNLDELPASFYMLHLWNNSFAVRERILLID
jgi:PKD repeat protein